MKKILFVIVIFLPLMGECREQRGIIQKLLVHDDGANNKKFDVLLTDTTEYDMLWCTATKKEWTADLTTDSGKAMYSTLLAAFMSGKQVILHMDSTAVCPYGIRNRIRNVELQRQ